MLPISKFQSRSATFKPSPLGQYVASNFCGSDYEAVTDGTVFETQFGGIQFGSAGVFMHRGKGWFCGHRRMHHIHADHIDGYLLSVPISGIMELRQAAKQVRLSPGSFVISSTAKPLAESIQSSHPSHDFEAYQVIVSGSVLRKHIPSIDSLCHVPIEIESGAGRVMSSLFSLALQEGQAMSELQALSFGDMLVEAIANTARDQHLLTKHPLHALSARARIREKAKYFIASNLSNPALSPSLVAEHCNISERYLHAAFADASITLGNFIKETRLDQCRVSLKDTGLGHRSVMDIAGSWGFKNAAHFSRAYKDRFGITAKESRY